MLQFQPSDTAKKFMESLAGRGDAALQLSAVLFPAETALKPASVYKALDLLHDSQTRMLLLREAYLAKSADFNTLSSKSATPAEKLLSAFFDKNSQRDLSITSMDTGEIAETVNLLGPSEKLYKMAAGCGSTDLDSLIKTEIIRKLCKSNLVAATRALANDPEAPDAAILLAIEGIGDDYTSAEAWAKRLVNPTTREEALSRLEKAKVETL